MVKASSHEELSEAFAEHLEQTKGHAERLQKALKQLDASTRGEKCKAMEGLIRGRQRHSRPGSSRRRTRCVDHQHCSEGRARPYCRLRNRPHLREASWGGQSCLPCSKTPSRRNARPTRNSARLRRASSIVTRNSRPTSKGRERAPRRRAARCANVSVNCVKTSPTRHSLRSRRSSETVPRSSHFLREPLKPARLRPPRLAPAREAAA